MSKEKSKKEQVLDTFEDIFKDDKIEGEENRVKINAEDIETLNNKIQDLNNKYLLALAEQQNYKKRMDEEMNRFYKYSTFDFAKELVQFLDSFDLALAKEPDDKAQKAYLSGFKMMRNQLYQILEKEGVKEIEALGLEFDPNVMISIGKQNVNDKKDQEVLQVFLKGYMYKDRVLRPANVIINEVTNENNQE